MLGRSGMNRIIAVLVMLLMGSSWQIISHQHEIRKLNIELEKEKGRYNELNLKYQRLELQNSKDTATDHVESIAREKEEAEAAKKAGKTTVNLKPVTTPTVKPVEAAKIEVPKVEAKAIQTAEKAPSAKKEVKIEEKSTYKEDKKIVPKVEVKKVETKPAPKPVAKKADPMDDQLGEFLKNHEAKTKGN